MDVRTMLREERQREREMAERYEERYPGWRRSSVSHRCPRWVAGKHCRAFRSFGPQCICQRHHLLDHVRMWIDPEGNRVLTAEPYHADGDDVAVFVRECDALGLRVQLSGGSPYFPGNTFTVFVQRRRSA